ncbi:MAG: nucleotidyl transferase AbiEii/AbiGii toxin family protein [Lentimicrobiaceae bacterium]|jgi:predicted nucleotidyltransferase component of viral defense system
MASIETLNKIKRLTISALVSDDILMGVLVLKGGNALGLAYDITNRGSIDIDFSMEKDFTEKEKIKILRKISYLLENEFAKEDLVVFDIHLSDRPKKMDDSVKSFWGGYLLEFKVISKAKYEELEGKIESIRRNALPIQGDNSPKFTVDISKYEYIGGKRAIDMEGAVVYVYSPEMLALEKLRALCQQNPDYKQFVLSITAKSRARDFYDIYNINKTFSIDFKSTKNVELSKLIFEAKHVPLAYIPLIKEQRELHRQSWESVINTVDPNEQLEDFDFYFEYVVDLFKHLS